MKSIFIVVLSIIMVACAGTKKQGMTIASPVNKEVMSHENEPILLGRINREGLTRGTYANWFNTEYNNYRVDEKALEPVKSKLKGLTVLVFMGTWCEDSQREVPRLFKIADYLGFKDKNIQIVSLDNHPDRYKQGPNREEQGYNIQLVPTIIFQRDGKELGRIVEYTQVSFEADMAAILAK
ncbi:MAG: thioredoxin family protein [Saprospiraceae bacterium]|jgi:thiol-disulfide isomerase/thioredoxin|nr:thioredoxin family protein [Saprospiraceae bacterium]